MTDPDVDICLDYDNAIRVSAWISHFLFEGKDLPDYCGEDMAPILDQIENQTRMIDVLECQGKIEWDNAPSRSPDRLSL